MIAEGALYESLGRTLERTRFEGIGELYEAKVRANSTRGDRRVIVTTDRISAFDRILGTVPFKGQVLTSLAAWWFERTRDVAPNHLVQKVDPNALECVACTPLPVELVMRAYITGSTSTSMWTHYQRGERVFCGHALPEGLVKNQRLDAPLLTPATKAPLGQHDVSVSREQLVASGAIGEADFDRAAEIARALFAAGQAQCASRGLILVDTKYELGKTPEGEIVVIDEIHTPDSSRFWVESTYAERFDAGLDPEPLDKDFVRRYYTALGYRGDSEPPPLPPEVRVGAAQRYLEAFERITGAPLELDVSDPLPRLAKNLGVTSTSASA